MHTTLWRLFTLLGLILRAESGSENQIDNFDINELKFEADHDHNLQKSLIDSYHIEENYFQFYNWLAQQAKRKFNIDKNVDAILEKFRKEIVKLNGHIFPLPDLEISVTNSSFPINIFIRNWNISGGQTLYRNGESTLVIEPGTRNILINIPLAIYNGTIESGVLDLNIFGGTITADFEGDLQDSTYHIELTIYSKLKWPSISILKVLNRGLITSNLVGWKSVMDWTLAVLIILATIVIIFLVLSLLTCYFVYRVRKMSKILEEKKN